MFIGALALAAAANLPSLDGADPWLLRRHYLAEPVVAVDAGELGAEWAQGALAEAGRAFGEAGQELASSGAPQDAPRLVLRVGEAFPSELDGPLERLGFEVVGDQAFRFNGRDYERESDALVATFEDPAHPGLPVTIWYANTAEALGDYLDGFGPQTRPAVAAFRFGELELTGPLDGNGLLRTSSLVDRRRVWSERFEADRRLRVLGFTCRVPAEFELQRALDYSDALVRARRATLLWAEPGGAAAESPVAAVGEVNVIVHSHVADMQTLLGAADLSIVNPVSRTVHALLAPGIPHDGGAAVAESVARRFLGPPAEGWMAEAAGVSAAGTWWGRDLETEVARLVAAGVVPSLAELTGQPPAGPACRSPHVLAPLRGLLFQHLSEVHGEGYLRDLWSGTLAFDAASEDAAWKARLAACDATPGTRRGALEPGAWTAGAQLVPGPVGYGSRETRTSLDELASLGARAVTLRATYYRTAPEAVYLGRRANNAVPGPDDDLALASAAAAARAAGLEVQLELHVLSSASGGYLADLSLPGGEDLAGFFADYHPLLVHAALVAERIGAVRFSVGSGLANTSMLIEHTPALNAAREVGWNGLLDVAEALTDATVLYTASGDYELTNLAFAERLPLLAVEFFPRLDLAPGGGSFGADHKPEEHVLTQRLGAQLERSLGHARALDKPLLIASVGFASAHEAWMRTDWPRGSADPDVQADLTRGLWTAVARLGPDDARALVGLFLWNWSSYPSAGGLADTGYTPQGKPARAQLPKLFANPHLE